MPESHTSVPQVPEALSSSCLRCTRSWVVHLFHRPLVPLGRCWLCLAAWALHGASTRTSSSCWSRSCTRWPGAHAPLTPPRFGPHPTKGHRTATPGEGLTLGEVRAGSAPCPHCPLAHCPHPQLHSGGTEGLAHRGWQPHGGHVHGAGWRLEEAGGSPHPPRGCPAAGQVWRRGWGKRPGMRAAGCGLLQG